MDTLIGLVILIADIWAIYQLWTGATDDMAKRIIWTLVILILPIVGLIIWWFAGPKKA